MRPLLLSGMFFPYPCGLSGSESGGPVCSGRSGSMSGSTRGVSGRAGGGVGGSTGGFGAPGDGAGSGSLSGGRTGASNVVLSTKRLV